MLDYITRPMAIAPSSMLAVAPCGVAIEPSQALRDEALALLAVPHRVACPMHHLVAADRLTRSLLEKRAAEHRLELFQASK
jgi:hypothetical protein